MHKRLLTALCALLYGSAVSLFAIPAKEFDVDFNSAQNEFHVTASVGDAPDLQFSLFENGTNKYLPAGAIAMYIYKPYNTTNILNSVTGSISSNIVTVAIPTGAFTNTMEAQYAALLIVESGRTNTFARGLQTLAGDNIGGTGGYSVVIDSGALALITSLSTTQGQHTIYIANTSNSWFSSTAYMITGTDTQRWNQAGLTATAASNAAVQAQATADSVSNSLSSKASTAYADNMATKTNVNGWVLDGSLNGSAQNFTNIENININDDLTAGDLVRAERMFIGNTFSGAFGVKGDSYFQGFVTISSNAVSGTDAVNYQTMTGMGYLTPTTGSNLFYSVDNTSSFVTASITNAHAAQTTDAHGGVYASGSKVADTTNLNGQAASYYLNAANQTNTASIANTTILTNIVRVADSATGSVTRSSTVSNQFEISFPLSRLGSFNFLVTSNTAPYNYALSPVLEYPIVITNLSAWEGNLVAGVADIFTVGTTNPASRTLVYTGLTYTAAAVAATNQAVSISVAAGRQLGVVCTNGAITNLFIMGQYTW